LRCAVARYVSVHVNVSGSYRHVPRNSATQTTNVAYKEPYVVECMSRGSQFLSTHNPSGKLNRYQSPRLAENVLANVDQPLFCS